MIGRGTYFTGDGFDLLIKSVELNPACIDFTFTDLDLSITSMLPVLSIHFTETFLKPYFSLCPELPNQNSPRFLSHDMAHVIHKIIHTNSENSIMPLYITALVHELISLVIIQVSMVSKGPDLPDIELACAQQARKIILSDPATLYTVDQIARKTGTTETKLQAAFKHLYGQNVGKFSRESRLQTSYRLLKETTYPLRVICEMVGYPDPSNFSVAFKKHYGFWPGLIQKKKC